MTLRKTGRIVVCLAALPTTAFPAMAARPEPASLTWVGGPTMLLRFGPIKILTDPVLGEGPEAFRIFDPNVGKPDVPQARLSPLPHVSLDGIDLVLVSHTHEDHLDRAAIATLGGQAEFLVPAPQVEGAKKRGIARIAGIELGETRTLSQQGYQVTITAVAARHSTRPELLPILGKVNGYWLEFRHRRYRRTIYWTGDSFAPEGPAAVALQLPDLFVPHLGGVGAAGPTGPVSMGSQHALDFARDVKPRAILPIHHSTFSLYREPIGHFYAAARQSGLRVRHLKEGEQLKLK